MVNITIYKANFGRICVELLEQTGACIYPPICTNRLIFGEGAFLILFFLNMLTNRAVSKGW